METVVSIFCSLLTAAAAVGGLLVALYLAKQVQEVHVSVNSRFDQLLELAKKASFAEGVKHELEREKT